MAAYDKKKTADRRHKATSICKEYNLPESDNNKREHIFSGIFLWFSLSRMLIAAASLYLTPIADKEAIKNEKFVYAFTSISRDSDIWNHSNKLFLFSDTIFNVKFKKGEFQQFKEVKPKAVSLGKEASTIYCRTFARISNQ